MRNRCLFMSALGLVACVDLVHSKDEEANKADTITLEDAIIAAYNGNIEWINSKIDKDITDEEFQQAKLAFLPSINAVMNLSRTGNEGRDLQETRKNTGTDFGVEVKQNIFHGFSTLNKVDGAQHESNAAVHLLRSKEQKLIVDVFEKYADVWFLRTKVSASTKMEENMQKLLSSQNSNLEVGTVTPAEVADASAKHQMAIYDRIKAESELFSAESEFEKITGLKVKKHIALPEIKLDLPKTLDILVSETLKSNSKILYSRLKARAAEKELDVAKGELCPNVELDLKATRRLTNTTTENTVNRSHNHYEASLQIRVPIFSNDHGNNSYSAIAIAGKKAQKASFEAEDAVREAKEGCVVNWNDYVAANASIRSTRSAVQSAELSNESNIEEANLGVKSNTDIWEKENTLLKSRIGLAESKKQKIVSGIKLLSLTGNLNVRSVLDSIRPAKSATSGKTTKSKPAINKKSKSNTKAPKQ
ncbi:hypothetical protein FACS189472_03130 [Alphaproteobacteria bacterium]|nr:hypothetical protein FACS189472_03130 [Alphaproteobacteria bacterium]